MIEGLLAQVRLDYQEFTAAVACGGFGRSCLFRRRIEVGIEEDAAFRVVRRLIGKGGDNMKYIAQEAGVAHVRVVGRGSELSTGTAGRRHKAEGPLAVFVSAATRESLENAAALVDDLLTACARNTATSSSRVLE